VSLDALDDGIFRAMNDVDFPVAKVLEGIDAAAAAGLAPVKVNMVVKRGMNEHEILPMARHFKGSGHILRFIEYMDVGHTNGWRMDDVVPSAEVLRDGSSDERISDYVAAIWLQRGDRNSAIRSEHTVALPKIEMSYIGG